MTSVSQAESRSFALVNLGCKVNRVESDEASALLLSKGWKLVSPEQANIIVINTCTVTGEAEKKTRKAVHHALSCSNAESIIVTGCASAISPEVFSALSSRVQVVAKSEFLNYLECLARGSRAADGGAREKLLRTGKEFNTRVGLKIQDGCAHACTYCIVHVARGLPWSKPVGEILGEVRAYSRAGVKEIVLSGINLGSFQDGSVDFAGLLKMISEEISRENLYREPGQEMRVRLSSIEPMDVSVALIELLAESNGLFCRHLHLPVQSGSSKVLSEMHRPYTAEDYLFLIERLRAAIPQISLSTDIIAGFPGENREDFASSVSLCKEALFSKMHVFPFSRRKGTPAAARSDQVSAEEKSERARQLRALGEQLRQRDRALRAGTVERALVESSKLATTESYYEVVPPLQASPNTFIEYRF